MLRELCSASSDPDHPAQELLCGNLEENLNLIVLVDLHPVDQRRDDQVLGFEAGCVVFLGPGEELIDLRLGGFSVLFLCVKPGFGLLNGCGVLIQLTLVV